MRKVAAQPRADLRLLVIASLLAAAFIAVLYSGFGHDPRAVPAALETRPAPAFELQDLDGKTHALKSYAGRPVVLNFWATWCQPCKLEHEALQDSQRRYPDARFLGVIYGDTPDAARAMLRRGGSAYPNLIDPAGRMAIDYGVAGVPETYFIDANGVVARKISYPLSEPELAAILEPLLEKR